MGFLGGSDGKDSACNAGDPGSIPGLGRCPGEGNDYELQYSCLEEFHGQRSLVGYSPQGCKESDTTERLTLSLHGSSIVRFLRKPHTVFHNGSLIYLPSNCLLIKLYKKDLS